MKMPTNLFVLGLLASSVFAADNSTAPSVGAAPAPIGAKSLSALLDRTEQDQASLDYAAIWNAFLAEQNIDKALAAREVLGHFADATAPTREDCTRYADDIARARREAFISISVQRLALSCAQTLDDAPRAARIEAQLGGLIRHAMQNGQGIDDRHPIRVLFLQDVDALVELSGYTPLGGSYSDGGRDDVLVLALWLQHANAPKEVQWHFDPLSALISLDRDAVDYAYPVHRIVSTRGFINSLVESGDSAAQITLAVSQLAGSGTDAAREARATLNRLSLQGDQHAAVALARNCLAFREAGCAKAAIDNLLPYAEKLHGQPLAMLAVAYATGEGVKKDAKTSAALLKKAESILGAREAHEVFATLFAFGRLWDIDAAGKLKERKGFIGLPPAGQVQAIAALRRAADSGSAASMSVLATLIMAGKSREKQPGESEWLLEKAIKLGHSSAKYRLAVHLLRSPATGSTARIANEQGQAQRHGRAVQLLEEALDEGVSAAVTVLRALYSGQGPIAENLTKADAAMQRGAHLGDIVSMKIMAVRAKARADHPSAKEALAWYRSAAVLGDPFANYHTAELWRSGGNDLEPDRESAREVMKELGEGYFPLANLKLLLWDLEDAKSEEQRHTALGAVRVFAEGGMARAQYEMGRLHEHGRLGVAKDLKAAAEWYRQAAEGGDADGMEYYAYALHHGYGVSRDVTKSVAWREKAIDKGQMEARNNLAWVYCTANDKRDSDLAKALSLMGAIAEWRLDSALLDTYAACSATNGDFAKAVAQQQRAMQLRKAEQDDGETADVADMQSRLDLYQKNQRYIDAGS